MLKDKLVKLNAEYLDLIVKKDNLIVELMKKIERLEDENELLARKVFGTKTTVYDGSGNVIFTESKEG